MVELTSEARSSKNIPGLERVSLAALGMPKTQRIIDGTSVLVGKVVEPEATTLIIVGDPIHPGLALAACQPFSNKNDPKKKFELGDNQEHILLMLGRKLNERVIDLHKNDPKNGAAIMDFVKNSGPRWFRDLEKAKLFEPLLGILSARLVFAGFGFYERTVEKIEALLDSTPDTEGRDLLEAKLRSERFLWRDETGISDKELADIKHRFNSPSQCEINFAAEYFGSLKPGNFAVINSQETYTEKPSLRLDSPLYPSNRWTSYYKNEAFWPSYQRNGEISLRSMKDYQPTAHFTLGDLDPVTGTYPNAHLAGIDLATSRNYSFGRWELDGWSRVFKPTIVDTHPEPEIRPIMGVTIRADGSKELVKQEVFENRYLSLLGVANPEQLDTYAGITWFSQLEDQLPDLYDKNQEVRLEGSEPFLFTLIQVPAFLAGRHKNWTLRNRLIGAALDYLKDAPSIN